MKFAEGHLRKGHIILIASGDIGKESCLEYPTIVSCIVLMTKFDQVLDDLQMKIQQRCYFYSTEGALKKLEWVNNATIMEATEEQLENIKRRHDCYKRTRTDLSDSWQNGIENLQAVMFERRLKNTRRKQTLFSSRFIM